MEEEKEKVKKRVNAVIDKHSSLLPLLRRQTVEKWFINNLPKGIELLLKTHNKPFPDEFKNEIKEVQKYLQEHSNNKLRSY